MLTWIAVHPGWVGMGLGILIGFCVAMLVMGLCSLMSDPRDFDRWGR